MRGKRIGIALIVGVLLAGGLAMVAVYWRPTANPSASPDLSLTPPETSAIDEAHLRTGQRLINDGLRFLIARQDAAGGWGEGMFRPGTTALVLKALAQHPDLDPQHPAIQKGVAALMSYRHDDGGFYDQGLQNYCTSIAVMALTALKDPANRDAIDGAVRFLKGIQIAPGQAAPNGQAITAEHPFVGGTSYGQHGRPDLSNLAMTVQAWHDAGLPADDPNIQAALAFVTRTQNFNETNDRPWALLGENDGGFIYAPALAEDLDLGESKADELDRPNDRGHRSYGSMTYAGFKSMLYAGLARDDQRVRAAFRWIQRNWRLDSNPNMPHTRSQDGLYYYYHVFARALRAWGEAEIEDPLGTRHNWRHELIDALAERVRPDGAWVNASAERWGEADPVLATAFAVLALQESFKQ